ncbi:MAG: hypothetical protein JXJ04_14945 [Spirochaetales bacterium]|nr:hypothetical protein [Spirochaetales bacterium]
MTESYFYTLTDDCMKKLHKDEILLWSISGEESDFIRFNKSKIRQPGSILQCIASLHLIINQKHTKEYFPLTGNREEDLSRITGTLEGMRKVVPLVPDDPYLLYSTTIVSGSTIGENKLPTREEIVSAILHAGTFGELIGIYAGGRMFRGFANSLGQKNWYENYSFNFNWSYYHTKDKAVKSQYAGFDWDDDVFIRNAELAGEQVAALSTPAHTIKPGKYRVYFAPAAIEEFISLACWGGFGLKSRETKQTPFLKMIEGNETLSPLLTIQENTKEGVAPNFQEDGYIKPPTVSLIAQGKLQDFLISPRSAKEYAMETNGANNSESPESVDMAGGSLKEAEILSRIDNGIYINNVWYLNYSDRQAARITGMTRFATFWVENGKIKAPLNVMRFDETLLRMFGENLIDLTRQRSHIIDPSTYEERSTSSMRLPGALVKDFNFTL